MFKGFLPRTDLAMESYGSSDKKLPHGVIAQQQEINGIVNLTVGNKQYYVAVVNGVGNRVVNNLADGTYEVKAKLAGEVTATVTVQVFEAN